MREQNILGRNDQNGQDFVWEDTSPRTKLKYQKWYIVPSYFKSQLDALRYKFHAGTLLFHPPFVPGPRFVDLVSWRQVSLITPW